MKYLSFSGKRFFFVPGTLCIKNTGAFMKGGTTSCTYETYIPHKSFPKHLKNRGLRVSGGFPRITLRKDDYYGQTLY